MWITTHDTFSNSVTNDFQNMPPLTGLEIFFGMDFYKDVAPTALGDGMNGSLRNCFHRLLDSVGCERLTFPINLIQFPTK